MLMLSHLLISNLYTKWGINILRYWVFPLGSSNPVRLWKLKQLASNQILISIHLTSNPTHCLESIFFKQYFINTFLKWKVHCWFGKGINWWHWINWICTRDTFIICIFHKFNRFRSTLHKTSEFHLIFCCGNFVKRHRFRRVSVESPEF